ncbi:MAG TPA: restriction endonuclease subunit S [Acinetobacter towneri]|nr:restriction endonuclease subunit S [Acinetobacter towneri]
MAKYQKYAEYKDSGVEWLEQVPKNWEIIKIKHLSSVKRGASPRPIDDPKYFDDNGEYAWVRIADVSASDTYLLNTTQTMSDLGSSLSVKLEPNELFLSIAGTVGKPCINKIKACIHDGFVYFPDLKIPNKFLFYVFAGEQAYKGLGKMGTQLNLNTDTVGDIKVALPKSIEDIQNIINFLDHETAKIDSLIAKQEKLIELLKEKRQAVISHAVTKGLNPDVAMKDSAVEWLGNVPEHWNVIKFNHCVQIRNGLVDPRHENYKNLILYAPNHIDKGTGKIVYKETAEEQGADSNKYLCFKGEVIYSKIRPALAKVAICEEDSALCSADMYPMDGFNGLSNKFLYYFILSDSFTEAVILDSDRVAMPKINRESLSEYKLPIPPLEEQKRIIDFIETTGWNLDKLEQQAQKAIQLMQERRIALISSAVTGKIDVRNWQHPNEAKTELSP